MTYCRPEPRCPVYVEEGMQENSRKQEITLLYLKCFLVVFLFYLSGLKCNDFNATYYLDRTWQNTLQTFGHHWHAICISWPIFFYRVLIKMVYVCMGAGVSNMPCATECAFHVASVVTYLQFLPEVLAKIKLPKKRRGMVIFWIQLRKTYRDLSSQSDPARGNWIWTYLYFNKRDVSCWLKTQ